LAEELHNPSLNVPIAMVGSVVINGLMGFVYCIVLLYSAPSLDQMLGTSTGFPFMEIFLQATRSHAGATIMALLLCAIATAATVAGLTSTSRTLWAFARDKATPFHDGLSKVDARWKIPLNAVYVVTALEALLGFIYLGNSTAFNAILSMAIIGMYVSYALPLGFMIACGRRKLAREDYGPFRLGFIGPIFNVIAMIWMIVAIVFSTFPTVMPVTEQNMNYSIVVMSGWLLFGGVYYVWFGRKKFEVPLTETTVLIAEPGEKMGLA
jgi:amino acid transporter